MTETHKRWVEETMKEINRITPDVKGKAFEPDWFLLRQRLEQVESSILLSSSDFLSAMAVEIYGPPGYRSGYLQAAKILRNKAEGRI